MEIDVVQEIRKELVQSVDARTRDSAKSFFKEEARFYGVRAAVVTRLARVYFQKVKHLNKERIFTLCEELLKSDYGEEAFIAFDWAYRLCEDYEPGDFTVFENWLNRYVNNWAKCDTLCNHAVGAFIMRYPGYVEHLKRWTRSDNRWLRRAASVSLIIPARKGEFLKDIFEIADSLLQDGDDLVQKGYGWMLKEASRLHQDEVLEYVLQHRKVMPRTALRYAIEKMPADLKRLAMKRD